MTPTEQRAAKFLVEKGWAILNSGWPDFLCMRRINGKIEFLCVEVKGPTDSVRVNQERMLDMLVLAGLHVLLLRETKTGYKTIDWNKRYDAN